MMNSIETQAICTVVPSLDQPASPDFPLDPSNPLVWILVIAALLGNTDEVINAIAKLLQAIASFRGRAHDADHDTDKNIDGND